MGQSPQHARQRKGRSDVTSASKHVPRSPSWKARHKRGMLLNRSQSICESFPDSLIVCDSNAKIVRINATAHKLFEVAPEALYQGTGYKQFLEHYTCSDEQNQSVSSEQWLMNLVLAQEAGTCSPEHMLLLHLPSGRKVSVNVRCFPLIDSQRDAGETVFIFREITHRYQKALHLQRVYEAVRDLTAAIAQIPEYRDLAWPEETFLLSPPVLFVAQQLVEVIHHVLECHRVLMLAFGPPAGHMHFVAGSGYTPEQEQYWREIGGCFLPSEVIDETMLARLSANEEAIFTTESLCKVERFGKQLPLPAYDVTTSLASETFLLIPVFLEQQWVGALAIIKANAEDGYTPEEIALVKAVTRQTALFIDCIHCLHTHAETRTRALVLDEVNQLTDEFLMLASHELRTPLTGIMGNLQLAQRRLETLKSQLATQPAYVREDIAHAQQPLTAASRSAQLQQRMINDLIDDARIQTHTLPLSLKRWDLRTLLREVVATQQQSMPEHAIVLEIMPTEQEVPIIADAGRIKQVLNTYLTNALSYSPAERSVTVQLTIGNALARVSVHDEGPGIPEEEREHLWDRFYRAKGNAVQHELDLSFGLGLYLCQVFIEQHQGSVGVQSVSGQGATFWFTLPIAPSAGE